MKKVISVLLCAVLMLSLCSCQFVQDLADMTQNGTPVAKTFEKDGFSIELDSSFLTMDFISEEYAFIWGNAHTTVMGLFVEYGDILPEGTAVETYAKAFRETLEGVTPSELRTEGGVFMLDYEGDAEDGGVMSILTSFHQAEDGIWIVMYSVPSDEYEERYETLCGYAKSVKCE